MKHLLPSVPGCATGRMQAAGPDRRRQALPHYRRNGGNTFLLDAGRDVSRETSPDRDHDQNTGITTAARRNGPAAGGLPPVSGGPECPKDSSAHPRTLQPSDKPNLPGAGGAHVSRETSPAINLRMRDIPDADGQNQIAGNEPFRSYRRGGGSTFLPDAGRNVSRETCPDRAHTRNTGITTVACQNGPAAGDLPPVSGDPEYPRDSSSPHPRTLQLSDRTTHPELAERMFHVKHLLPSISECATSQMQTARTEPLATNPFAAINGTTTAPSCRMPGGMFHVKHSRTAPDGQTHLKRSGSRLHLANRSAGNAISV